MNGQGTGQAPPGGKGEQGTVTLHAKTPVTPHRGLQWHPNPRLPPNGPLPPPAARAMWELCRNPDRGGRGSTFESDLVLSPLSLVDFLKQRQSGRGPPLRSNVGNLTAHQFSSVDRRQFRC